MTPNSYPDAAVPSISEGGSTYARSASLPKIATASVVETEGSALSAVSFAVRRALRNSRDAPNSLFVMKDFCGWIGILLKGVNA